MMRRGVLVHVVVRVLVRVLVGSGTCALGLTWVAATAVARWTLQPAPNPVGAAHSQLLGVSCASKTSCVAVGYSAGASGGFTALAEHRDGSTWSIEPTPHPSGASGTVLSSVSCTTRRDCTAVGYFTNRAGIAVTLAERWSGGHWSVQRPANPAGATYSYLVGVSCASRTSCVAVGSFADQTETQLALTEMWNGANWSLEPIPNPAGAASSALKGVNCATPTACTAVGTFLTLQGVYETLVERWNGAAWTTQPSTNPPRANYSQLIGVSCSSISLCEAVGYFSNPGGPPLTLAERWNGVSWTVQATPNRRGARTNQLFGVSCGSATTCTAVGNFASAAGAFLTLAERGKRNRWAIQRTAHPATASNSGFDAVSCPSPRSCLAVGYLVDRSGTVRTLAERYM